MLLAFRPWLLPAPPGSAPPSHNPDGSLSWPAVGAFFPHLNIREFFTRRPRTALAQCASRSLVSAFRSTCEPGRRISVSPRRRSAQVVSHLESMATAATVCIDSKGLMGNVSRLDATLTKNKGGWNHNAGVQTGGMVDGIDRGGSLTP